MLTGDDVGLIDAPLSSMTFSRLEDCYCDPRTENRPSKFVRAFLGSPGSTSTIARNSDGTRCAVAGKEALKIIRILEAPGMSQGETTTASSRRSLKVLAKGVGGAQLIEDLNLWSHARPSASYSITDASWGFGPYANKIVTSCASGDVLLWDITKTKLEKNWREEHLRAVNKILFVPSNPHVFLTGSQDTHVKIWDMRIPNAVRLGLAHSTAVRALCMPPSWPVSPSISASHPSLSHQVLVALEGGDLIRWDLRAVGSGGGRTPMDKVPVAHRGAILGIDWIVSTGEDGKGWVCTGGQDRTVKVWDMSQPTLSSIPQHTLHTPHPVRRVKWRPESNTEIAVVPRTIGISPFGLGVAPTGSLPRSGSMTRTAGISNIFAASSSDDASAGSGAGVTSSANVVADADRIEIWDVRRHYVSKYVLLGSEGAVSDATWTGPDSLCGVYKNGSLTRHDVQHSYAPLDYMPRHAVTWDPMGGITFLIDKRQPGIVPFDDMPLAAVAYHRIPPKTPMEPPFESSQVAAFFPGPIADITDLGVFRALARNYIFSGDSPINMCIHNSHAALKAEDYIAVQMWDRLKGLLTDPGPFFSTSPSLSPVRQPSASHSVLSSVSFVNTNAQISNTSPSPLPQSKLHGPGHGRKRRTSSIGFMSNASAQLSSSRYVDLSSSAKQQPSRSSSRETSPASPYADVRRRNGIIAPTVKPSTNSGLSPAIPSTPILPDLPSPVPSRSRSSPRPSRGSGGRGNRLTQSREPGTSGTRRRSLSLGSAAALLALQDDSGSGDESDQGKDSYHNGTDRDPPNPLVVTSGSTVWRSPLSQTLAVAISPSLDQSGSGFLPPVSESSVVPPFQSTPLHPESPPDSEASEGGAEADDNYYSSTSPENDSPMLQPVNGQGRQLRGTPVVSQNRVTNLAESYLTSLDEIPGVSLPRQFSETSVLTAVPPQRLGEQYKSPMRSSQDRTSPGSSSRHASSGAPNLSLSRADHGIGVVDETSNGAHAQTEPDSIRDRGRKRRRANSHVTTAQNYIWDLGWTSFRSRMEEEIDNGNIQLASALAVVGGERVMEDRWRVEQLNSAYVELLSRLRLHTSAALVRKSSAFDSVREPSMLDTVIHMSCGSCHKVFLGSSSVIKAGQYQYCTNCRESKARCAICRLPVRGLLFFCQICAHGGHQECYRSYLLARPLVESHTPESAGQFRGRLFPRQPRFSDSSVHSTRASPNEWQQQQLGAHSHTVGGPASLPTTEENEEGPSAHHTLHSSGNSSWGFEKRRLRYHPCPTGCGHDCWAANHAA